MTVYSQASKQRYRNIVKLKWRITTIAVRIIVCTSCQVKSVLISWRSQSIKIGTDLSIDKSIKIGTFDLIDVDFIDQSVEIDDILICFIAFS